MSTIFVLCLGGLTPPMTPVMSLRTFIFLFKDWFVDYILPFAYFLLPLLVFLLCCAVLYFALLCFAISCVLWFYMINYDWLWLSLTIFYYFFDYYWLFFVQYSCSFSHFLRPKLNIINHYALIVAWKLCNYFVFWFALRIFSFLAWFVV